MQDGTIAPVHRNGLFWLTSLLLERVLAREANPACSIRLLHEARGWMFCAVTSHILTPESQGRAVEIDPPWLGLALG